MFLKIVMLGALLRLGEAAQWGSDFERKKKTQPTEKKLSTPHRLLLLLELQAPRAPFYLVHLSGLCYVHLYIIYTLSLIQISFSLK